MRSNIFHDLSTLLSTFLLSPSEKHFHQAMDSLSGQLDFDSALAAQILITDEGRVLTQFINHSYDETWLKLYIERNLLQIDPYISMAISEDKPFVWNNCFEGRSLTEEQIDMLQAMQSYGLSSGIAYGLESNTSNGKLITFCSISGLTREHQQTAMNMMYLLLPMLQYCMDQQPTKHTAVAQLTPKEQEVLKWAIEGKTCWETSIILSVTEAAIKFHLNNIYKKFGVSSKAQAIVKAISSRHIEVRT